MTDGDTMDVRFANGSEETGRPLGVDTPEVHAEHSPREWETVPETQAGHDWLRQWGTRASEFATNELDGERVEIRVDSQADRRGGYGRLLVSLSLTARDAFAAVEADAREYATDVWGFGDERERQPTSTSQDPPLEAPHPAGADPLLTRY